MSLTHRSIAVSFIVQMLFVILIISSAFYFVTISQSKNLEQQLKEKAELFATILGSNMDKILGDNIVAFENLQNAVLEVVVKQNRINSLDIISSKEVIVASSDRTQRWQTVSPTHASLVQTVLRERRAASVLQVVEGQELVLHFVPILSKDKSVAFGVIKIVVPFDMRQASLSASLRSNRRMYFRKESADIANDLAQVLQDAFNEAQRNLEYLNRLIANMQKDEDLVNVEIFTKQWGSFSYVIGERSKLKQNYFTSPVYAVQRGKREQVGSIELEFTRKKLNQQKQERQITILAMNTVITLAFCFLIGFFFKRRILNPVKELTRMAESIKADDLSQRIKVVAQDELGQLAATFNAMGEELSHSRAEIKSWNMRLQNRIEDVTKELEEKQDQLLKTEKLASMGVLSSGIAHEINNPLGVILGEAQILLDSIKKGKSSQRETEEVLKSIEAQTKRCSHIVKSLLQFSRAHELNLKPCSIHAAIDNALLFTQERLSQKEIQIDKRYAASLPDISADAIQLEQVFVNMLMNAEQSMEADGVITITTEENQGKIFIEFQDTGSGVEKENIPKVFDPFFTTKDPGEGIGLGLSVSYALIKAHGGDIRMESEKGQGTRMIIQLPLEGKA